jgi:hypothetical protein
MKFVIIVLSFYLWFGFLVFFLGVSTEPNYESLLPIRVRLKAMFFWPLGLISEKFLDWMNDRGEEK